MSDLAWAVKNGDLDQVKEMVEGKVSDPPVFIVIKCDFKFLILFQGLDVNADIDGRLALHYAGDYGQLEVLKFLVSKVCECHVSRVSV